MNRALLALLFIWVLILSPVCGYAQNTNMATAKPTPTTIQSTSADILKAQLDESRAANAAILQTVYWSLGTTLTLLILIIGLNIYNNRTVAEHDRKAIKAELTDFIKEQIAAQEGQSRERINKLITSTITKEMESTRQSILLTQQDLLRTGYLFFMDQAIQAKNKKDYPASISLFCAAARASSQMATHEGLDAPLDGLRYILKEVVQINADNATEIHVVTSNLPPKYSEIAKAIAQLVVDKMKS